MNLSENFEITTHQLSNGLKLILIPNKKIQIISLNLAYKVGSKNELRGKTGMAHLFEHLMFEGSKNLKKGEFDKICSLAGGTNNAYTSYDSTAYTMTLPSNQLEVALWLESDRMSEFAVTQKAMETQKKVVSEEIRQTVFDRPYGKWRELLAENAFTNDCSYSWEVHGSIEDVLSVNLDDLKEFFEMFYRPGNAVMTLCGNFEIDNAIALTEKYFNEIKNNIQVGRKPAFNEAMLKKNTHSSFDDTVPLPATFINFHIPGSLDDRVLIVNIISTIATGGRSSRMYSKLVDQQQIASTVGSYIDDREFSSIITFYGITANPNVNIDTLKQEMLKLIFEFKNDFVSELELNRTINQLTTQISHEIQYSSGLADIASSNILFSDDLERIYGILEKYEKINAQDIKSFASDFLTYDAQIVIDCLPKQNS